MHNLKEINLDFFYNNTEDVALSLLGKVIKINGKLFIISDTEAYLNGKDLASHARFGNKGRAKIMYQEPGRIYIYMIYGVHFMLNFVAYKDLDAGAVLIRGVIDYFNNEYIDGPGRVAKKMEIDKALNGKFVNESKLKLMYSDDISVIKYEKLPRVGIPYAKNWAEKKLRFKAGLIAV